MNIINHFLCDLFKEIEKANPYFKYNSAQSVTLESQELEESYFWLPYLKNLSDSNYLKNLFTKPFSYIAKDYDYPFGLFSPSFVPTNTNIIVHPSHNLNCFYFRKSIDPAPKYVSLKKKVDPYQALPPSYTQVTKKGCIIYVNM